MQVIRFTSFSVRGRRQGRQPLIRPGAPWPWHSRRRFSPLRRREGRHPLPPTHPVRPKTVAFYGVLCSSHFWPFFGSCGSRWANTGQHSAQDGPTWPRRWANIASRWAKIAPRWANIAPRWANIGLKMGQHSSKMGQLSPKIGPHSPKMSQHSPKIGRRPSKYPAFYSVFFAVPIFRLFWLNMHQHEANIGQHSYKMGPHCPQDRPT